jgi:hypothetical protein
VTDRRDQEAWRSVLQGKRFIASEISLFSLGTYFFAQDANLNERIE